MRLVTAGQDAVDGRVAGREDREREQTRGETAAPPIAQPGSATPRAPARDRHDAREIAAAQPSHGCGPSQTSTAAGSGSGSHGSTASATAAPRRDGPGPQRRPRRRQPSPGDRDGDRGDEDREPSHVGGSTASHEPSGAGSVRAPSVRKRQAGAARHREAGPASGRSREPRPDPGSFRAIFRSGAHATIRPPMAFPRAAAASIARAGRGAPSAGAIGALGVLLAIAFTWPVAPRLGSVGRFDTGDGHWSIWCVAWVAHALATDPGHLYDANIFYPHDDTLAYSENNIVAGVLGLPACLPDRQPVRDAQPGDARSASRSPSSAPGRWRAT